MKKEKKSTKHIVATVIGIILVVIMVPILVMNVTMIIKSYVNPDEVPSFGGISPMFVMSGSMEPTINEGDLIFRGMSDHRWQLLPSIARQPLITEETEYNMVKELMLLYPKEFANISSNFDLLAKMQHYGLPTRLLDFTTNPLVALYFACHKEKKDSAGRVVCTNPSYPQYLDEVSITDEYIEAVCGLCKVKSFASYFLENLIENKMSFSHFSY